jgi:threonine/homoserine/homoserine lactone efflux protein
MDISLFDWVAFVAAILYLLILPGYNIMRTLEWDGKFHVVEKIVVAFGISVMILLIVSTALALSFSIGLNFYTLMIPETIIIILSTKEVVTGVRKTLKV